MDVGEFRRGLAINDVRAWSIYLLDRPMSDAVAGLLQTADVVLVPASSDGCSTSLRWAIAARPRCSVRLARGETVDERFDLRLQRAPRGEVLLAHRREPVPHFDRRAARVGR